jgi:hypothetical protein
MCDFIVTITCDIYKNMNGTKEKTKYRTQAFFSHLNKYGLITQNSH